MCTCEYCTINGIPEETLKPGSNSGIPGGDAETRDNPGKPGILGRYARVRSYNYGPYLVREKLKEPNC